MQTECHFSLSVMCDDYATHILNALRQATLDHIQSRTDALSTTYRGTRCHVLDALRSVFGLVNDEKTHITMEATFTNSPDDPVGARSARPPVCKDCPSDTSGAGSVRSQAKHGEPDDTAETIGSPLRTRKARPYDVRARIAFYPLGIVDYAGHVSHVVSLAQQGGLYQTASPYGAELFGGVQDLFDTFDAILTYAEAQLEHYVLQVTLSINSPTKEEELS